MLVLFRGWREDKREHNLGLPSLAQRATSVRLSFGVVEHLQRPLPF